MPVLQVCIKWNGQKFDNVDLDTDQPGLVFKTQLYSLTQVSPDRQKVLIKGSNLKDDADMNKLNIKQGQVIMMMGTVGELPKEPEKPTVFLEDMTDSQLAEVLQVPSGLENLGNTCYLNSSLQCMRAIPELETVLETQVYYSSTHVSAPLASGGDQHVNLMIALKNLFKDLKSTTDSVHPLVFVQLLRMVLPRFAETNNHGYLQQDAEECWGELVSIMRNKLPGLNEEGLVDSQKKFVEQFMTGEMTVTLTCDDAPQETSVKIEPFDKLTVNIGSGVSTYMITDIQNGLTQSVEKNSTQLGRSAKFTQTSRISRLPYYLVTNFVRFQWKASENVRAKILKRVKFPFDLDVTSCCTNDLQTKLTVGRDRIKELDDKKAESKKAKRKLENGDAMQVDGSSSTPSFTHKERRATYDKLGVPADLASDIGANVSGWYELVAVLTHVGRTAESGHYIGWVKDEKGHWWKYDDDKVSPVKEEDISKLEGGGDWHSAYICLYKSKSLDD